MSKKTNELSSCRRCGSPAKIHVYNSMSWVGYKPMCTNRGCGLQYDIMFATEQLAIDHWNIHIPDSRLKEAIEVIRETGNDATCLTACKILEKFFPELKEVDND